MSLINDGNQGEHEQYSFALLENKNTMLFIWEYVEGLSIADFRDGIITLATQCKKMLPDHIVIDAASLDQNSPAVKWLQGEESNTYLNYSEWWSREILPIYHEVGVASLAVGTGDPNAPGALENSPPGVNFKIGYFTDVEAALSWRV